MLCACIAFLLGAASSQAATGGAAAPTGEPTTAGEDASAASVQSEPSGEGIVFGAMRSAGATWYGPGFYGNRTACGQILRPDVIGVAHRSLPCGTVVKLAYHGHAILTTVIDRGPYARGYEWDLTNGARLELGLEGSDRIRAAVPLRYNRG